MKTDVNVTDLTELLAKPITQMGSGLADVVSLNPDDFKKQISSPEPEPEPEAEAEPEPLAEEKWTEEELDESAETWIGMMDLANMFLMPLAYKSSLFTKEELRQVAQIKANRFDKDGVEKELNGKQKELVARFNDLKEAVEALEFSDYEVSQLKGPFKRFLKKYPSLRASPIAEILMALLLVQGPRLAPLTQKFIK